VVGPMWIGSTTRKLAELHSFSPMVIYLFLH
jgi:hypothetical protein